MSLKSTVARGAEAFEHEGQAVRSGASKRPLPSALTTALPEPPVEPTYSPARTEIPTDCVVGGMIALTVVVVADATVVAVGTAVVDVATVLATTVLVVGAPVGALEEPQPLAVARRKAIKP